MTGFLGVGAGRVGGVWVEGEDFRYGMGCDSTLAFSGEDVPASFPVVRFGRYVIVGFIMVAGETCSDSVCRHT